MDEGRMNGVELAGTEQTCFFTLVGSIEEAANARLLIDSLRAFGGQLSDCEVWVFLSDPTGVRCACPDLENVHCVPLARDEVWRYHFARKVRACAQAEAMTAGRVRSLVWVSTQCLIVNPPALFTLVPPLAAAFRPVHIQNVGLPTDKPLDPYWKAVYRAVGIEDTSLTVESLVDMRELRPYFNSHLFAVDPSQGLCQTWLELFGAMVADADFQSGPCRDELHRIFLHQAILSAMVVNHLDWQQIGILPPEYSYPLHLHDQVPPARRAQTLNQLVCPVYEGTYRHPETLGGVKVEEPLRSWLAERSTAIWSEQEQSLCHGRTN
jgi:hypothetical protein